MERSTEANKGCHYAPKKASKGDNMCSVVFVAKNATDGGCCCLHGKVVQVEALSDTGTGFAGLK